MANSDYITASSYVRVLEKKLLTAGGLDRSADAPGALEALRMLSQGSDYNFTSLPRPEDYEGVLKEELRRVYKMAYNLSPDRAVVDILACKYDYHNCKAALKERLHKGRTPPPYFTVTDVAPAAIEASVANRGESALKSDLPPHLVEAIELAYQAYDKTQNPQSIDIALDKAMLAYKLKLAQQIGNEFILAHVKASVDFYNVLSLLRAKNMQKGSGFLAECLAPGGTTDESFFVGSYNKAPSAMVPAFYYKSFGDAMKRGIDEFEKTGNYAGLERLFDNYLIDKTRQVKFVTYGPEILYAYLFSKENEIRQVRIVVTGKQNGIRADALKERLRENYA